MLAFQVPVQIIAPADAPLPLNVALARLLDAYDLYGEGHPLTPPPVLAVDRPALRWLLEALSKDLPENPFPKGSTPYREAEALRSLLKAGNEGIEPGLARLALGETGSQMALWRWGRRMARAGRLTSAARLAWEDALLAVAEPTLVTGYALRHALSFALAEEDLKRFGKLKATQADEHTDLVLGFQKAFGLLGTPGPALYLWALPGLQPERKHMQDLGAERIWICPPDPVKQFRIPPGVAWVIPSGAGAPGAAASPRNEDSRMEAEALARTMQGLESRVWFAHSREDLEACGLTIFPVLIKTDFRGFITSIRIGEAAPAQP